MHFQPGNQITLSGKRLNEVRRIPDEWQERYVFGYLREINEEYVVLELPTIIRGTLRMNQLRLSRYIELYPADFPDVPWDESSEAWINLPKPLPRIDITSYLRLRV